MKPSLIKLIACPHCKGKLKAQSFLNEDSEIIDGILTCKCKRWYPIANGIPRIVPDNLRNHIFPAFGAYFEKYRGKLPPEKTMQQAAKKSFTEKQVKTIKGFGYEWTHFTKMHPEYEKQFLDWVKPLKPEFFKNKLVLDAGCGTGRHTAISAKFGAETIGIDLSQSVEVAYKVTRNIPKAHIIQADIYNLPFKENTFDFIYCIGVLHHLPEPEKGFQSLVRTAKKNGLIHSWVYGREGNTLLTIMDPIRKHIISKLPLWTINMLAYIITLFSYPAAKIIYGPLNRGKTTKILAQNLLPQNAFFHYLSQFNFNINHSIVFDQLLAPIAYYYTKEEFESWFIQAQLKDISITWRNRNSWRGFGVKSTRG